MNPFQRTRLHMTGTRGLALDQARGRLVLLSAAFALCYIVVAARAFDVAVLQGDLRRPQETALYEKPDLNRKPEMHRADIVDRNGVLLASSLKTASLYADPALILEPDVVAKDLANLFPDLSYEDLQEKLSSKRRFVWIKRNLTPEDHYRVLYLGYPGLGFREEDRRIYPQGSLAAHIVGYAGVDGQGLAGVEASFDSLLQQDTVKEKLRKDRAEGPLALTIDVRLQHVLRREIGTAIRQFNARAGTGIIMDVENGEVLAAVSLPDFDPHAFEQAPDAALFNRTTLGVYELGSTFKIFSTAALLETGRASMGRSFDVREPLKSGRFEINDYHAEKRFLTLPEVFIHSSNIGAAMMGREVGTDRLQAFYADLGLLDAPSGTGINEIGAPLVPNPWRDINTLTASYGHGIAVSPLQLVTAVASIVNGGISVKPSFILDREEHKNAVKPSEVRIVSPQTAHRMRQLMRLTVTDGTGVNADVPGYRVGGKTGTAEKPGHNGKGYDRKRLLSSFLAVFPMEAPRYAVYIMVDEPEGNKASYGYATGGWVAAPAAGRVIASMASILGISPRYDTEDLAAGLRRYVKTAEEIRKLHERKENQIASH